MKIIYLNTWCGRTGKIFFDFLNARKDIDVFCFQEIYHNAESKEKHYINDNSNHNLLKELKESLPDYNHYYRPHLLDYWGLSIAVRNNIEILGEGEEYVHKQKGYDPENEAKGYTAKNLQYIDLKYKKEILSIYNFHGLYNGSGKSDNIDRIEQSTKVMCTHIWRFPVNSGNGNTYGNNNQRREVKVGTSHHQERRKVS